MTVFRTFLALATTALTLSVSPVWADDDKEKGERDGNNGGWNQGLKQAPPQGGAGQADCRWTFSCGGRTAGGWKQGGNGNKGKGGNEKDDD